MFERPNIRFMSGYVPGKQPNKPTVKLNTNENPLAPSAGVVAALSGITPAMLQRYPDPLSTHLREAIAAYHGCNADEVIATNGSDELLRLVITTFADPGAPIGVLDPGYNLYSVLAQIQDCPIVRVPLGRDWRPPEDTARQWNEAGVGLALIANPQAPSGILLSKDWLVGLAEAFDGLLLVDEAYADFIHPDTDYDLVREIGTIPNLLISRTLSKGHSLAGLRLGYGLGPAAVIAPMLHKVRDSYNVDVIAQVLGEAALKDVTSAKESWELVQAERTLVAYALEEQGFRPLPSEANFLLVEVPPALGSAEALHAALAERDFHVRWFDDPRLADCLRISIGTEDENDQLLVAIRSILKGGLLRAS